MLALPGYIKKWKVKKMKKAKKERREKEHSLLLDPCYH
jgi:hypothetical protein